MSAPGSFHRAKAYALQQHVYLNDRREAQLLRHVLSRPDIDTLRGSPRNVLAAIDDFGRQERYLINVGKDKAGIITKLIHETCPRRMIELGGYVGYSAILFGNAARAAGAQEYLCLESNTKFATIASALIDLAGLGSFVKIIVGSTSDSLRALHAASAKLSQMDVVFLNHYDKPATHLPDLQLCEQLHLVRTGTVIVADNVTQQGNAPYLAYVRSDVESKKRACASRPQAVNATDSTVRGNPNLVYESQLIQSFEPTGIPDGVEVTICVARDEAGLEFAPDRARGGK